jgi:hypothetical protein
MIDATAAAIALSHASHSPRCCQRAAATRAPRVGRPRSHASRDLRLPVRTASRPLRAISRDATSATIATIATIASRAPAARATRAGSRRRVVHLGHVR